MRLIFFSFVSFSFPVLPPSSKILHDDLLLFFFFSLDARYSRCVKYKRRHEGGTRRIWRTILNRFNGRGRLATKRTRIGMRMKRRIDRGTRAFLSNASRRFEQRTCVFSSYRHFVATRLPAIKRTSRLRLPNIVSRAFFETDKNRDKNREGRRTERRGANEWKNDDRMRRGECVAR